LLDESSLKGNYYMAVITVNNLTKDYGRNRGVFDVSFAVGKGEVFGFIGPNGAGKTTTIRNLLGFSRPQEGSTGILGMDSWKDAKQIQRHLGYLPGEIAFPNDMKGMQFIKYIADMRGMKNMKKAKELIDMFQFDPTGELKRMSKGMKQKIGIVCAFMSDPEIFILDEPTSGLDPLMQSTFVQLIASEKAAGKSILMSSHMFEEVEETSDRIGMIKGGRLVAIIKPKDIRHAENKTFKIEFLNDAEFASMCSLGFNISGIKPAQKQIIVDIEDADINGLLAALATRKVKFISETKHTLEEFFMQYYEGESSNVQ
jgi:ABC-2 type transport system ATP-binding protein